MEAKHLATVSTSRQSRVPCAVGVFRGNTVLASAGGVGGTEVWLWWDVFSTQTKVIGGRGSV